jgi:hypothetical protein
MTFFVTVRSAAAVAIDLVLALKRSGRRVLDVQLSQAVVSPFWWSTPAHL